MDSTWDGEDAVVVEVDAADKAGEEDVVNAHRLRPTCRIRRRAAVDAATTGASRSHQEERE